MKIERKHECQHCNKEFEWYHQVAEKNKNFGVFQVEKIPNGKTGIYQVEQSIEKDGYKVPLKATVYCPHCDRLNKLEVQYDE